MSQNGTSYAFRAAAVATRVRWIRERLARRGLMQSPYVDHDRNRAWLAGYEAAIRDLAEHPEIVEEA